MTRRRQSLQTVCCLLAVATAVVLLARPIHSASYIFAATSGVGIVTHPLGYTGTGGTLSISVGIDPTSANAAAMAVSVQNMINTFNGLVPTDANLVLGASNNVPANFFDFESVALHELGHALGLAHPNAASESGLSGSDTNYTRATTGTNGVFNLGFGADLVRGSSDDVRGDDVNLHWFRTSNNNPFTIDSPVDSTTYSRTAALPSGHTFSANADRSVSGLLMVPNTEAAMQQGTADDEAQRTLGHDDVAGIRYAMAGLDEVAGNADDYTITLTNAGLDASADIVIDFDNSEASFANTKVSGTFINFPTNVALTSTGVSSSCGVSQTERCGIFFNDGYNWFFNDVSNTGVCTYGISDHSVIVPLAGASDSVAVIAQAGCGWTAVSNDAWITVTDGASGNGDGAVSYTVDSAASSRTGTVTIAGKTFTVTQGTPPPPVDLAVSKTESADVVVAGSGAGNLTYVVTVVNNSASSATGVTLSEVLTLPSGVSVDSYTPSGTTTFSAPTWTVGTLAGGASETLTVVLTVGPSAAAGEEVIADTATVTAANEALTNPGDDTATETTSIDTQVDLMVGKTESVDPVVAGSGPGNLTYVVTVANSGPSDATGVALSEVLTLPAGVSVDAITPSGTTTFSDPTWTVGSLASGVGETLTVVLTVGAGTAPGTDVIGDTAMVTSADQPLINLGDDGATEMTSVSAPTSGSFTDDPLTVGTPVRAVHITELRTRINALRAACLAVPATFVFADPTLTPGVTPVRAVHLTEMRTALSEAYVAAACGQTAPSYAATITAGSTLISAAHITELRALVVALETIAP